MKRLREAISVAKHEAGQLNAEQQHLRRQQSSLHKRIQLMQHQVILLITCPNTRGCEAYLAKASSHPETHLPSRCTDSNNSSLQLQHGLSPNHRPEAASHSLLCGLGFISDSRMIQVLVHDQLSRV